MKHEKMDRLLKGKKGHTLECFLFVLLFLGSFLSLGTTGHCNHLKHICDAYYGSWDAVVYRADAALYDDLQQHAAVEQIGRMDIRGYVLDSEAQVCGSLGYADEAFLDMGFVELESGRFPEQEDEIAVEASVLLKLGYEKKLNQEIVLDITENLSYAETAAEGSPAAGKKYQVCGIVNNYTAHWQDDGEWLVSCFLWNNPNRNLPAVKTHLYLSFKQKYSAYCGAVETVCHNRGRWQTNAYRETGNDHAVNTHVDCHTVYYLLLYGLLFLAGVTFLFYMLGSELWKNREWYRCLLFLGLGKNAFFQMCFQTKWKRVLQFCFSGCLSGMGASVLFYLVIQPFGEIDLSELFDAKTFLLNMAMVLSGALLLIGIILLLDYCIIKFNPCMERNCHRKYQRKEPFSVSHYFQFFLAGHRRITGFLLCGISLMLLICTNTSWKFLRDYRFNMETYPYDYIFGGHVNYNRNPYMVSKRELSEICSIEGITEVYYYSIDEYETASYESRNLSFYENYSDADGCQLENSMLSRNVKKIIMGISNGLMETWQKDLELDEDLYRSGGIILYVPDLYLLSSGQMGTELWMKSNAIDADPFIREYRDTRITIGDTIYVDLGKRGVNLKVAGILRSVEANVPQFMVTMAPYSILCNYDVYEELFGEEVGYSCVMINTDDDNDFQTDLELSKTSAGYWFQNYKSQRNGILTKFIFYLILSVFLIEAVIFLSLLLGRKGRDWKQKRVWDRMQQFHILGMTIREIKRELVFRSRLNIAASILLADGIFMAVQVLVNLFGYGECVDDSAKLHEYLKEYVGSKTLYNTNFPLLIAASLFLFVLFRALQYWNMHRMLKEMTKNE